MNPWDMAGQMMGMGAPSPYQQQAYYLSQVAGNSITVSNNTFAPDTAYYADDVDNVNTEAIEERAEEPPDEFTQLSNHKFHELLDRFSKLT